LEFPVGAENCGLGESGVSLAENVFSAFWNPASIPAIGDRNSLQLQYGHFYELLLPAVGIDGLWHTDTIQAIFLSNVAEHFDFGFVKHVNFLNFGRSTWTNEFGEVIDSAVSDETVTSYGIGLRYRDMVSLGLSIKDFDSRLAPGYGSDGDGTAQGQVFDFGVRLEKKFSIGEILDIHPAFGLAVHSFPQDSTDYTRHDTSDTPTNADPLPLKRWHGASIKTSLLGLLGVLYVQEREYAVVDQEFIDHQGYKISITPFYSILRGEMNDPAGSRRETYEGYVVRFNYQEVLDVLIRTTSLFNTNLSGRILDATGLLERFHLKPNFLVEHAESEIFEKYPGSSTARIGQTREETTLGISIIGELESLSFKGVFRKRKREKTPESTEESNPEQENVIEVEDRKIVE
jgi:hypothetical protein